MTDYWVSGANLTLVADAIRSKTSTSAPLVFPSGFVSAIDGISAPYYDVYSRLAYNVDVTSASEFANWANSLSIITSSQFAYQNFGAASKSLYFNNCLKISGQGFIKGNGNATGGSPKYDMYFPKCSYVEGEAFLGNLDLNSVSIPVCTYIGYYAFQGTNITQAYFPSCISVSVGAFSNCAKLTTASFPVCTSLSYNAFYRCISLTTVSFPVCSYIGNNAFQNCSALTTASFPECTGIGSAAFTYCSVLTTASFPSCTSISNSAFASCPSLTTIYFPNCITISSCAFSGCRQLSTANFSNCTAIGSSAFSGCYSLLTADFSKCEVIGDYAFRYCSSLTTASFPKCTSIGINVFQQCYSLISLYLNSVSTVTTLGGNAFASTPIGGYSTSAGRYGSVFVPSSLYNSFITATNWAAISARIVSV